MRLKLSRIGKSCNFSKNSTFQPIFILKTFYSKDFLLLSTEVYKTYLFTNLRQFITISEYIKSANLSFTLITSLSRK